MEVILLIAHPNGGLVINCSHIGSKLWLVGASSLRAASVQKPGWGPSWPPGNSQTKEYNSAKHCYKVYTLRVLTLFLPKFLQTQQAKGELENKKKQEIHGDQLVSRETLKRRYIFYCGYFQPVISMRHKTQMFLVISLDILIVFLIEKINNEMNNEPSHKGLHVSNKNTVLFALLLCTSDNTRQANTCLICMLSTIPCKHFPYKTMKSNSTNTCD